MKSYLLCILFSVCLTMNSFGQYRNTIREIEVSMGGYMQEASTISTFQELNDVYSLDINAEGLSESTWYSNLRHIRSFELAYGIRRFQSKDLRKEIYIGAKLSGQFQRNTILIGTSEILLEETVIDKNEGRVRRNSRFKTSTYSEFNDFVVVGPMINLRALLNDKFSINSTTTVGGLLPVKSGIQEAYFTGNVTRNYVGEYLESESKEYDGVLEFDWKKAKPGVQARIESSINLEFKPLDKKPYYFGVGMLLGTQFIHSNNQNSSYRGYRFSIHSQF